MSIQPAADPTALHIARASIDAAPAPALVVDGASVYANASAAQWLARFDTALPMVAGELPAAHAFVRTLRRQVQQAADAGVPIPLRLGPLDAHRLTARKIGAPGAPVLIAWVHKGDAAATELDLLRERLAAAAGVARVGLFERDLVSGDGAWDPVCFELFGIDPSAGVPDRDVGLQHIDPRDRDRVKNGIARFTVAPVGSEFVIDFRVMLPGGGVRHLESRSKVVASRDSEGRRAIGALLDVSERFSADEIRHELTQRLEQVAEAGRVGLWLFNPVTRVSEWNAQMYALSGRHPDAGPMTLDEALACVHPDDRQADLATTLIEQGLPVQARLRLRLPDGSQRWVFVRASRIGGDSPHLAAAIVDITDLQAAEARSQQLHERLNLAVAAAGIGIYDLDVATGKAAWNDQLYALMLRSPDEQPYDLYEWSQQLHPDDRHGVLDRLRHHMLIEGGLHCERYRLIRADRSVIEVEVQANALRDDSGKVTRVVGTVRDVTSERRAITDREQLLKRLQLANRVANIGVWESRLDDGTEVLDDAACRLLGFGSGPQLRTVDDFLARVHPDDIEALKADLEAALDASDRTIGPMSFRILRPDGELRHVLSYAAIERDANGRALKILGTALDVTELKRAEQNAQRVADRLEVATGLGGLGVFERDANDRFIYYDGVVSSLWNVGEAGATDALRDPLYPVVKEDRPMVTAARERMRAVDEPVRCEYRVALSDGRVRDVLSWRRRRLDARGRYAGEIGAILDITDLRDAQRRAQEFSTRLSIATASAGMGVWELDLGRCMVIADQNAHAVFDGQLLPSPTPYPLLAALIDAADRERLDAVLTSLPDAIDLEFRVHLPGGSRTVAARGEVHRDAAGRAERVVGVVWDVTARRAAERTALEISARLQLATVSAGIGSWQRTLPAGAEQWDAQMYRLCDAGPQDGAPGEVLARCMHPEDLPRYEAALERATEHGGFSCEFRVRRGDGSWRWITSRGKVRELASGVQELLAVAWDVTGSRDAEAALLAKEAAERASRAKSEFLSRMSHELRTPLNAIVGFTQLLELDPGDPMTATQRERVGLIRSAGWHLLKLINDVLDLSRIESGRSSVAMEVVAWRSVLDDAIAMVQPDATQRGIVLETRHTGEAPDNVWADPVRLRQVLLNLLSNAVNYNRDNGSVQVDVRSDQDHIVFAVRDSGRGMSANQMTRLFQPFNRLGSDSSTPGSGIGLAISQRLVQQMEGSIEVDSQAGVGSEFRVRLRCARVQKRPLSMVAGPTSLRLSAREEVSGTLLYIEDNPANSALVEQFLQFRPRIKLYQAADGATGLVMAAVCQPDLILIDIRLPDMMGDEVLQQLRRQPETRGIPCVAVSANAMPHDIEAALAAGFADYWTKPLEVTRFLRGIDERLEAATATFGARDGEAA